MHSRRFSAFAVALAALAAAIGGWFAAGPAYAATTESTFLTFYGWYDNTPPGAGISYPQIHSTAGGTGTYSDPITFATDSSEQPPGTVVYVPRVKKYFIMEDSCEECSADWTGHGPNGGPGLRHLDLWLGGKGGDEMKAIDCEDALTDYNADGTPTLEPVIVHPPSGETVDSTPLFNVNTGACYGGAQPTVTVGQYKNGASGQCIDDPGDSSASATALTTAACNGSPEQQFTFEGAFLMIHGNLCANNSSRTIKMNTCTGGPSQQWSVNPNGTITDIQTGKVCIATSGTKVVGAGCSGAAAQWTFTASGSSGGGGGGGCTAAQLVGDPGFENGSATAPWTESSTLGFDPITQASSSEPAHSGSWEAWLDGNGTADTDTVAQPVAIPAGCKATFSFWLHVDTTESTSAATPDTFTVQVVGSGGTVLATVATFSNLNAASGYMQHTYNLSAYAGQTVTLRFTGQETDTHGGTTSFVFDDAAVQTS